MSMRYFQTPTGAAQYGNLAEDGLRVLLDAGYEEITAEEYKAEQERQAEAADALIQRGPIPESSDPKKEASADGRNGGKRRGR